VHLSGDHNTPHNQHLAPAPLTVLGKYTLPLPYVEETENPRNHHPSLAKLFTPCVSKALTCSADSFNVTGNKYGPAQPAGWVRSLKLSEDKHVSGGGIHEVQIP
jgi:hypothetical protein